MNHQIPAIALLLASILTAIPAHAETTRYRGFCDASAAVALGPRHFVVADDDRDILTIYPLGKPDATASVDLGEYLGNRQAGTRRESRTSRAPRASATASTGLPRMRATARASSRRNGNGYLPPR
jgi:hypothetical protein